MSNIENIKQNIKDNGLDLLAGEFISPSDLQDILSDIGYRKGDINNDDSEEWYSIVVDNFNGALVDFRTISPDNEEYRIIINSLSGTDMVEAIELL